jgi:hypothetical protein
MLLGAFFEFQFNLKIKITKLPLISIFTKLAFIGFFFFHHGFVFVINK